MDLSCVDPLVRKLCKATFLQICSDKEQLIQILDDLRVSTFSAKSHFWENYSFKIKHKDNCKYLIRLVIRLCFIAI